MRRLLLSLAFLGSAATTVAACADESDGYECTVRWFDMNGGTELATKVLPVYEGVSDAEALEMCQADQNDDPDKPGESMYFTCECAST